MLLMFGHIFLNYKLIMFQIEILSHSSSHKLTNFFISIVRKN